MAVILRELEIIYWNLFDNYKYMNFLYYLEMGLLRKYAYERIKKEGI